MSINALLAEIAARLNDARRAPVDVKERELADLEAMVRNARADWLRENEAN